MQRDTALTFGDIHGSLEAFQASVDEIQRLAMVFEPDSMASFQAGANGVPSFTRLKEATNDHSRNFRLRHLVPHEKPMSIPGRQAPPNTGREIQIHLRLTDLSEYVHSQPYVAVSYTWDHVKSHKFEDGDDPLPEYYIWTGEHAYRPAKCHVEVLHRAMRFAAAKLPQPRIWIDQECIEQDNPDDLENHLQIMHKIYSESSFTVAVLSSTISTQGLVDVLDAFLHQDPATLPFAFGTIDPNRQAREFQLAEAKLRALDPLDLGRWQNLCPGVARDYLAISNPEEHQKLLNTLDIYLILRRVQRTFDYISQDRWFKRTWTFQEKHCGSRLHFLIPIGTAIQSKRLERIGGDICLEKLFLSRKMWRWSDHSWESTRGLANLLENHFALPPYEPQGTLPPHSQAALRTGSSSNQTFFGAMQKTHQAMETCDNLVVADRIAIFASVNNFPTRLKSTLLNRERYSYSTCILTLALKNSGWFVTHTLELQQPWGLLNMTLEEALINLEYYSGYMNWTVPGW